MSKFKPLSSDDGKAEVQKIVIGGWRGPMLQPVELKKDAINPEADLADVNRRLTRPDTAGSVEDLARRIVQVYRRIVAPGTGVHTLSLEERRSIRDRMIAAMTEAKASPFANDTTERSEALFQIASVLAGLDDEVRQTSGVRKSFELVQLDCPHCHKTVSVEANGTPMCPHCLKTFSADLRKSQPSLVEALEKMREVTRRLAALPVAR